MTDIRKLSAQPNKSGRLSPSMVRLLWVFVRIVIGSIAAFAAAGLAAAAWFIGAIETTGCFIECGERNLVVGIPSLIASVAMAVVGFGVLWWAFVDRYWSTALRVLGVAGLVGVFWVTALTVASA